MKQNKKDSDSDFEKLEFDDFSLYDTEEDESVSKAIQEIDFDSSESVKGEERENLSEVEASLAEQSGLAFEALSDSDMENGDFGFVDFENTEAPEDSNAGDDDTICIQDAGLLDF